MDSFIDTFKKFKSFFLIPFIILLAFLTRFIKLQALFHWSLDEEYWSFLPHNIATFEHIPLIGGHIGGTGVYSGPFFVWLMGIVFGVLRSNPILIAAFVSLLGVISTLVVIKIAENYSKGNQKYLAGFLYATSILVVLYERKYWNASLALILANLLLLVTPKIIKKTNFKLITFFGIVTSLAFQAHMTGLVHFIYSLVILIFYKIPKKYLLYFVFIFLLTHLPLLGFELRHDFLNTKNMISFLNSDQTPTNQTQIADNVREVVNLIVTTYGRIIFTPALDISNELTLCTQMANKRSLPQIGYLVIASLVLLYSLYLLVFKRNYLSLLVWINIILVFIYKILSPENFYSGQLSEYYLLPSFGAFLIILADLIENIRKKTSPIVYTLPLFLIIINLHIVFNLKHSHSFERKLNLFKTGLELVGNQPYTLNVVGNECQIYGYRFISSYLKKQPVESYVDPVLGHLYKKSAQLEKDPIQLEINEDLGILRVKI